MQSNHNLKHILLLRNPEGDPIWGGLEKLMFEWFERIDYSQCKVTLAISQTWVDLFKDRLQEQKIPVEVVALPFVPKKDLFIKRFFKLLPFLNKKRPSTIVFMQGWMFSFNMTDVMAGFLVAPGRVFLHENQGPPKPYPRESKKHFGFIDGLGAWWYIQIYKAMLRAHIAQKILVVSKEIKENLVSLWHYPSQQVLVKYHGIDLDAYKPSLEIRENMRRSLKIAPDETVIIAASRLSKEKCVDRTIKAFDILSQQITGLTLMILGKGPLEKDLKESAKHTANPKKILFLGHVDNVGDYLKTGDIFVLSSDIEGFGIALIEAMATGLICVATKCPGPNEIIQNGVNGFLVEKNSAGVLDGLRKALDLPPVKKTEIQEKASRLVSENFKINEKIKDVFSVLGIDYLEKI